MRLDVKGFCKWALLCMSTIITITIIIATTVAIVLVVYWLWSFFLPINIVSGSRM